MAAPTINKTPQETPVEPKSTPKVSDGPKKGDKGEFLPSKYKVKPGIIREDR